MMLAADYPDFLNQPGQFIIEVHQVILQKADQSDLVGNLNKTHKKARTLSCPGLTVTSERLT